MPAVLLVPRRRVLGRLPPADDGRNIRVITCYVNSLCVKDRRQPHPSSRRPCSTLRGNETRRRRAGAPPARQPAHLRRRDAELRRDREHRSPSRLDCSSTLSTARRARRSRLAYLAERVAPPPAPPPRFFSARSAPAATATCCWSVPRKDAVCSSNVSSRRQRRRVARRRRPPPRRRRQRTVERRAQRAEPQRRRRSLALDQLINLVGDALASRLELAQSPPPPRPPPTPPTSTSSTSARRWRAGAAPVRGAGGRRPHLPAHPRARL